MISPTFNFKRCLVGVETAKSLLDVSEDTILAHAEAGRLKYVFNLSRPDTHRRMLRIFALSLLDLMTGQDSAPPTLDGVLKYCLPGSNPEVRASWLARQFNCSPSHVNSLIAAGCLIEAPGAVKRDKKETRMVHRESARAWLASRRCV